MQMCFFLKGIMGMRTDRILHYFLGFPPYRTGGLTKFAVDLMSEQAHNYKVVGLWPGRMRLVNKDSKIVINKKFSDVYSAELINPLPVPLDEGVISPGAFMADGSLCEYERFLEKIKPKVIHLHTLMGLHEELLMAAKLKGIPIVYTTHDYYGICLKVYMFHEGEACGAHKTCEECAGCGSGGLSLKKIAMMQSPLYRGLKDSAPVKYLRSRHRATYFDQADNNIAEKMPLSTEEVEAYKKLKVFYKRLFSYVDCFHFTSSVAESVYKDFMPNIKGEVINITHRNINDNRKKRTAKDDKIRLTYLAPAKSYKGFDLIKMALDALYASGDTRFVLNIYSPVTSPSAYMNVHEDGYSYDELPRIFDETDMLLAPSLWDETFGYTVLEAVSYGIPVIISDRVGAKDIVGNGGICGRISTPDDLKRILSNLNAQTIMEYNESILSGNGVKTWDRFVKEMEVLYDAASREALNNVG